MVNNVVEVLYSDFQELPGKSVETEKNMVNYGLGRFRGVRSIWDAT